MSKQLSKKQKQEEEEGEDESDIVAHADEDQDDETALPAKEKDDFLVLALSHRKFCKVRRFANKTFVDFREYYEKDGKLLPGKKGIMLNKSEWEAIKRQMADISAAFENH